MDEDNFKRVKIEIKKIYYAHSRYHTIATFALLYHLKPIDVGELGKYLRISDHFVRIDEHHFFLNFTNTRQENAFKAAQNLLHYLDRYFQDTTSCIAIDTFDISKSPQIVINRLIQILDATTRHSYERIEDENILNELI
ncbi:MAG: hypothetical protein PHU40_06865 [Sulfurimonas sp.]|nr:hypothetical protein [Sulfurimonas sp.]